LLSRPAGCKYILLTYIYQHALLTSAMNFRTAVNILGRQITTAEIAEAAGMSPSSIRQARLQEGAPGYRTPPKGWHAAIIKLAEERRDELDRLVEILKSGSTQL
jgi:hypothetical protein